MGLPEPVERLITEFVFLPGVGPKTASRYAMHLLLRSDPEQIERLRQALEDVRESVHFCADCYNLSINDLCDICANPERDQSIVCVVTNTQDLLSIERTGYKGLYHVLHGLISPLDGVDPEQLHLPELIARVRVKEIKELIVTPVDVDGIATATWIREHLAGLGVTISQPARGLPVGTDIEYADTLTLAQAIDSRRAF